LKAIQIMKMQKYQPVKILSLLAFLLGTSAAFGFYDPAAQRWVNRDPIGEPGFDRKRTGNDAVLRHDDLNGYRFIANNPIGNVDGFGLKLYKCIRQARTMPDNLHAYLWDDKQKTSCGRTGGIYATGEDAGDKGPGTPGHTCIAIPGSDGKEASVMQCCRRVALSPFFPGLNDCHNWGDRCLSKNGLSDPQMNRFNDDFWNAMEGGVERGLP
jgi:RHS repeat-associated protein